MLAYCIELDGEVHLPLYEKLEAELDALRRRQDVKARARMRLSSYVESWLAEGDPLKELELKL